MNAFIHSSQDLVTSHEQTRAGFIEAALEKNKRAQPYIDAAKTLRALASTAKTPYDLLKMNNIRPSILAASGLSDKSLHYFTEEDKNVAIKELIEQFLLPAGNYFVDELVYRFLLIKGDSLGGSMRNYVGAVAKIKVTRKLLAVLNTMGIHYRVLMKEDKRLNRWQGMSYESAYENAEEIAALSWVYTRPRIVFFDTKIPTVDKNIDICLYRGTEQDYDGGRIVRKDELALMFGELKGGIDPAGADEHWKTGNTALDRIRTSFRRYNIKTAFVGAAIEKSMADEIWQQLKDGTLDNAANLTVDTQFTNFCEWIVKL